MAFMIITVYILSFHINQWKELVCWKYVFCWGSLDGICFSCEVPSIGDILGISEQYLFFCHQTGMVGHWILRLHTFYKSTHVEFKTLSTVETLTFGKGLLPLGAIFSSAPLPPNLKSWIRPCQSINK